ncbi:ABC transporter [Novimethylophilus kurashikiensis]|uniref:ABC transporter n=1 Tax=Novimethylophilus kurashikiensis TaxID=1825523 RepID=A0A2R5FBI0_9PROT|nr:GldG family protein [Novimethylophilus kurashikiensis]GBG15567.1 ABC transporter [Novimethylophilus kurashikiensis]
MKINRKLRIQLFMQNSIFVVLFLALVGLVGYLSYEFHGSRDITQSARNTLTEGSVNVLKQMKGPVSITVYASNDDTYRKGIVDFVTRYQRAKRDIQFKFVNPAENPKQAQEAGVRAEGEFVVEYKSKSEHLLPPIVEQDMTNLLVRLSREKSRNVMFLDGHGERRLNGLKNFDLGDFGKQLEKKGFKLSNPDLTLSPDVPANGAMLVIASPQVDIPEIEVNKIKKYIAEGGNLFWLIDQDSMHGLMPIAEQLGLQLTPGIVVDPMAAQYGGDYKMAFGVQYGDHPITQGFGLRTLFPMARQIDSNGQDRGWTVSHLVDVSATGWLETSPIEGTPKFDAKTDVGGPINIAVALERKIENKDQRVVVVGSGGFLANTFLGNGGNLDLGVNMINWLAGDDNLITIQPRPLKDVNITIPPGDKILAILIFFGFRLGLPIVLLITGVVIWLKRRKR